MRPHVPITARPIGLAAALVAAALAGEVRAQEVALGGVADLTGARALGLAAAVGSAGGNDALFVNPGALAARRRYEVELGAFVERRGKDNLTEVVGTSVVDSVTAPVAAGFSYRRSLEGDYTGSLYHVALAGPLADGFFLGVAGKWLSLQGPQLPAGEGSKDVSAATFDAGFLYQVSQSVSLGGAGYNLVSVGNEAVAPMGAGAGLGVDIRRRFHVALDWRIDLDRRDKATNRYSAGAEMLLGQFMPLRAGYTFDETLDTRWWSIGTGFVTKGVAFDIAYRQSTDASSARTLAAALRFYVFD